MPDDWLPRALKAATLVAAHGWRNPKRVLQALNRRRYGKHATSLRLLYAVLPLLSEHCKYDAICCHFGTFGLRGLFLRHAGVLAGKLVTFFHGADLTEGLLAYGSDIYRPLFADGDLFLPISERWRDVLLQLGCPRDRIEVHHMGIDCRQFSFRARTRGTSGAIRLTSVCRLVEKKGIEYAVQAVASLVKRGTAVRYDILGDGPNKPVIEKLIRDLRVESVVTLHGEKTKADVIRVLDEADVLLAPSVTAANGDQEGIPVALMEAMAMGLPVISTWHSGIPELVRDGECGLLVPERDANALAERLGYLIEHRELWSRFGQNGRDVVEREFNIDRLNNELARKFESLSRGH
jgi:colanic acid/amylovoran biosynthesis glycosyltransferase